MGILISDICFLAGALQTIEIVEAKGRALIPKLEREAVRVPYGKELEGSI